MYLLSQFCRHVALVPRRKLSGRSVPSTIQSPDEFTTAAPSSTLRAVGLQRIATGRIVMRHVYGALS